VKYEASGEGHIDIVRMLLSYGADVNSGENNNRALSTALKKGHIDIVRMLLAYGAEIKYDDRTAYQSSASAFEEALTEHGNLAIVNLLLGPNSARDDILSTDPAAFREILRQHGILSEDKRVIWTFEPSNKLDVGYLLQNRPCWRHHENQLAQASSAEKRVCILSDWRWLYLELITPEMRALRVLLARECIVKTLADIIDTPVNQQLLPPHTKETIFKILARSGKALDQYVVLNYPLMQKLMQAVNPNGIKPTTLQFPYSIEEQTFKKILLASNPATLTHISLGSLTETIIQDLNRYCPELTGLKLFTCENSDWALLKKLKNWGTLTRLDVSGTRITRLPPLSTEMQGLNLSHCQWLPPEEIKKIDNRYKKLQRLDVAWTQLDDIKQLPESIQELDISETKVPYDDNCDVSGQLLNPLKRSNLLELNVQGTSMQSSKIQSPQLRKLSERTRFHPLKEFYSRYPKLHELTLHWTLLPNSDYPSFNKLHTLNLLHCRCTKNFLEPLETQFPNLTELMWVIDKHSCCTFTLKHSTLRVLKLLNVEESNIDFSSSSLPQLETLDLSHSYLNRYFLKAFKNLASLHTQCPKLRNLRLRYCTFYDEKYLLELPQSLRLLDITGANVSSEIRNQLGKTHSNLIIVDDNNEKPMELAATPLSDAYYALHGKKINGIIKPTPSSYQSSNISSTGATNATNIGSAYSRFDYQTKMDPEIILPATKYFKDKTPFRDYRINVYDTIELKEEEFYLSRGDLSDLQLMPIKRVNSQDLETLAHQNQARLAAVPMALRPGEVKPLPTRYWYDSITASDSKNIDIFWSPSKCQYYVTLAKHVDSTVRVHVQYVVQENRPFIEKKLQQSPPPKPSKLPKELYTAMDALFSVLPEVDTEFSIYQHETSSFLKEFLQDIQKIRHHNSNDYQSQIECIIKHCEKLDNAGLSQTDYPLLEKLNIPPKFHNFFKQLFERKGSCRHSARMFMVLCAYYSIPCRVVKNNCHQFPEVWNGNEWGSIELGGQTVKLQIEKFQFKQRELQTQITLDYLSLPLGDTTATPKTKPQKTVPIRTHRFGKTQEVITLATFFKQSRHMNPEQYHDYLNYFTQQRVSFNQNSSATDVLKSLLHRSNKPYLLQLPTDENAALRLYHALPRNSQAIYIDNPEEMDALYELLQTDPEKGYDFVSGPLKNMFDDKNQPSIVVINFAKFSAAQIATYKSMLDELPTFRQSSLSQKVQIIACVNDNTLASEAFYSRFSLDNTVLWPTSCVFPPLPQLPKTTDPTSTHKLTEIDLYQGEDWRARLVGQLQPNGHQYHFKKGALITALETHQPGIIIQDPPLDDRAYQLFCYRLQKERVFYANGKKYTLPDDFKIYHRTAIPTKTNLINIQPWQDTLALPGEVHWLNRENFYQYFEQIKINNVDKTVSYHPGILKTINPAKGALRISSDLSASEYRRLCDALDKHKKRGLAVYW